MTSSLVSEAKFIQWHSHKTTVTFRWQLGEILHTQNPPWGKYLATPPPQLLVWVLNHWHMFSGVKHLDRLRMTRQIIKPIYGNQRLHYHVLEAENSFAIYAEQHDCAFRAWLKLKSFEQRNGDFTGHSHYRIHAARMTLHRAALVVSLQTQKHTATAAAVQTSRPAALLLFSNALSFIFARRGASTVAIFRPKGLQGLGPTSTAVARRRAWGWCRFCSSRRRSTAVADADLLRFRYTSGIQRLFG